MSASHDSQEVNDLVTSPLTPSSPPMVATMIVLMWSFTGPFSSRLRPYQGRGITAPGMFLAHHRGPASLASLVIVVVSSDDEVVPPSSVLLLTDVGDRLRRYWQELQTPSPCLGARGREGFPRGLPR
ncbi:hypothetical protein ACFE04_030914 [Oxalis oulophora]